jgi:RHS repeat-associated protein
MTDSTGNELGRILYEPFGAVMTDNSVGRDVATLKFTGKESDEETGLVNFGARYYDPTFARFITADSHIPGQGANLQGFNRYSYVLNNPVKLIDPSGHFPRMGGGPVDFKAADLAVSGVLASDYVQDLMSVQNLQHSFNFVGGILDTLSMGTGLIGRKMIWWGESRNLIDEQTEWYRYGSIIGALMGVRSGGEGGGGPQAPPPETPGGGGGGPLRTTPVDLHAFGNKTAPRPPRIGKDIFPNQDGVLPAQKPPLPQGASTVADLNETSLTGHYHVLPAGTPVPEGFGVLADGVDVLPGSPHRAAHYTIFNTVSMEPDNFVQLFSDLPWTYGGKL